MGDMNTMENMINNDIKLTDNSMSILRARYLKKDKDGNIIETPDEMFRRVAAVVSNGGRMFSNNEEDIRRSYFEYYWMLSNLYFLPNTPTLVNAGKDLGQLSACFVLPVEDSIEGIFESIKNASIIHKTGGGTGFNFSNIRPMNDIVGSTNGVSSGPVSFIEVFNAATEAIKQGGVRRGANMGILSVHHPDIEQFIMCKDEENRINNFNISVSITNKFIEALINKKEYEIINPRNNKVVGKKNASDVFNKIVKQAHKNGEPGIIFIDTINESNPILNNKIEATNPCGEQPLFSYESCNLGSINLSKILKKEFIASNNNKLKKNDDNDNSDYDYYFYYYDEDEYNYNYNDYYMNYLSNIDWFLLKKIVTTAVRFLDDVIEVNKYPIKQIENETKKYRKIGLGVMGLADLLIQLKVLYSSKEALYISKAIIYFIQREARRASMELGRQRGNFPEFKQSIYYYPNIKGVGGNDNDIGWGKYMRNATVTTIAPTGSLSIIANCSSGIEPLFAVGYKRKILGRDEIIEINPHFKKIMEEHNIPLTDKLLEKILSNSSIQWIEEIPDDIKKIFLTSTDLNYQQHIDMQAIFQNYVDNAVSKTINFPESATIEDVYNAFLYAYKKGCKGITIYRNNSRGNQIIKNIKKEHEHKHKEGEKGEEGDNNIIKGNYIKEKRPVYLSGKTYVMKTGCGNIYTTINYDDNKNIFEIFANIGKAGGCASSQTEAIGRLISLYLRSIYYNNINKQINEEIKENIYKEIVHQLGGISCHNPMLWGNNGIKILSCADAISKSIQLFLNDFSSADINTKKETKKETNDNNIYKKQQIITQEQGINDHNNINNIGACPDCGSPIVCMYKCLLCLTCGYSKC